MTNATERLDLIVLGATGFTGRLVVHRLAVLQRAAHGGGQSFPAWGVAGRNPSKLAELVEELSPLNPAPTVVGKIDVHDTPSLRRLVARCEVLLNLVGPYTDSAEKVIECCIAGETDYADLSGELPLLRRVIDTQHANAAAARVRVVQLAGWEALAPDVVTLQACRVAAGMPDGDWGPGAADPIAQVHLTTRFVEQPHVSGGAVSGGTLGSIVEIFSDPAAAIVGDPAGLLPDRSADSATLVRRLSPLRVRPRVLDGRLLLPQVPVAFLNPPVLHRTAALLAAQQDAQHHPACITEGVDGGRLWARGVIGRLGKASIEASGQRIGATSTRLPVQLRRWTAHALRAVLPDSGDGPTPEALQNWRWTVTAEAHTATGQTATATLTGRGHPGYTATAAMITALGLSLVDDESPVIGGVLTPAVAFGPTVSQHLQTDQLHLHVS